MTINDIEFCPFCGCDVFYTVEHIKGSIRYRFYSDDSKEAHNEDMYDSLSFYTKKNDNYIFCDCCKRKIADGETKELTKTAVRKAKTIGA